MTTAFKAWLDAGRPKTLPLALIAILTGSVLALVQGAFSWPVLLLSLFTACLLQILSNLANDYGDGLRGVDNPQRLGPLRALQTGALTATQLRRSLFFTAGLCLCSGLALLLSAGLDGTRLLTFLALGLLAIAAAVTYTVGRQPYGYLGLGDLSVWLFFGCLGVLGSFYLHQAPLSAAMLLPASASGMLAVAVLNINNMRDIDNDATHGKRTVAVRLGLQRAKIYHCLLLGLAALQWLAFLWLNARATWSLLLFLPALLLMGRHCRCVLATRSPVAMAPLLPAMVGCAVATSLLFAVALLTSFFITR